MRNTKWIYKNRKGQSGIKKLLPSTIDDIDKFLIGTEDNLGNPTSLKDVSKAIERIIEANIKDENIWIYGDYDVDGITSTSLAYLCLKDLGIPVNYYIPLRDEGYGLNKDAIKYIHEQGGNVIISVDCGINSHDEIDYAQNLGIDMIITDHHEITSGIPKAFAVINPKREDNEYKFKYLAGVGTIFMVMYALYQKLGHDKELFQYLDLVALGTIADIVPLIDDNRIFAKYGMKRLNHSHSIGLNLLIKKIYSDHDTHKFNTYDIGFVIAPIFNAAGRLEDAKMGVELLINENYAECTSTIYDLIGKNKERKEIQANILENCIQKIENEKLFDKSCIIVDGEDYHHGVIGIVASKIVDKYYKPTIVLTRKENEGIATASCRSIDGFSMIDALVKHKDYLVKFGGHDGAAGFTISLDKLDDFKENFINHAKKVISAENFIKPYFISDILPTYKVSYDFIDKLSILEPFGANNPTPLFVLKDCKLSNVRAIGNEKNHLMMNINSREIEIRNCVWWNNVEFLEELQEDKTFDILGKIKLESYKDKFQTKIYIEDIKISNEREPKTFELYDTTFPLKTVVYSSSEPKNNATLTLDFDKNSKSVNLIANRNFVGELDKATTYILTNLKKFYNYDFNVEITDTIITDSNYNIHIQITRNYDFKSYATNSKQTHNEIKKFLIGDFEYNKSQKELLRELFINKKNNIEIQDFYGVNTVIQTIGLCAKMENKKVLLVTDCEMPLKTREFLDISQDFIDGYNYYIYYQKERKNDNINYLSITGDKITPTLPDNIIITSEEDILTKQDFFSRKLPPKMRKQIIDNLKNYEKLYATSDIFIYLV